MKKAKIMLSVIVAFAFLGAALAFKVKGAKYLYVLNKEGTTCTAALSDANDPSDVQGSRDLSVSNATWYDPGSSTLPCTVTIYYRSE